MINNIDLFTNLNLRIIEGLSLNLSGNLDLLRDLRAIPKADLSLEEYYLNIDGELQATSLAVISDYHIPLDQK